MSPPARCTSDVGPFSQTKFAVSSKPQIMPAVSLDVFWERHAIDHEDVPARLTVDVRAPASAVPAAT